MPILRDIHNIPAKHEPELFPVRQRLSTKSDLSGSQPHISGQYTHDGLGNQRLAGPGFPNEGQTFTAGNSEGYHVNQFFFPAIQLCSDYAAVIM